ncbi:hypothetical protein HYY69_03920 [Candidatus Woesearchaeota archaeon]|nr:hypothetical protein [Candidatus Woesearchaeota archaeon]
MASMQDQFMLKIGQVAYTSNQVAEMLRAMNLDWYAGHNGSKIKAYAKKHGLFVDMEAQGIRSTRDNNVLYWIPKSNLVTIIEGMGIPATERDFEDAARKLEYQL